MPNAVGPETMEDVLVQNGIKDPRRRSEVMRVIAQHVTWCCQRRHPELFEEPEPLVKEPRKKPSLTVGDPDRMITCSVCRRSLRAGDHYCRRQDTMSGWGLRCKDCMKKPGRPEGYVPSNKGKNVNAQVPKLAARAG